MSFMLAVLVFALAACDSGISQEQYDAALAEKDSQISDLQDQIDELNLLYQKYKDLSNSEILAQAEAHNRKAEEDRLATEQLLAEEAEQKADEEQARLEAEEAEAKRGYETGITFDDLARRPDDYEGEKVKFTGNVLQVVEGDNEINLRIATAYDRNFGYEYAYDDVIFVYYNPEIVSSRILQNDIVILYGTSEGLYTYESRMGVSVTLPLIQADNIEINQ